MKSLLALVFLLTPPAQAQPRYEIPENATRSGEICAFSSMEMHRTENGWTSWTPVQTSETRTKTFWIGSDAFFTLVEKEGSVVFRKVTEAPPSPGYRERTEQVEEWSEENGNWNRTEYQVVVTLISRGNSPLRRIERREGFAPLYWDVTTGREDGTSTTQKILRNPSALNTAERKFSSYQETCVSR